MNKKTTLICFAIPILVAFIIIIIVKCVKQKYEPCPYRDKLIRIGYDLGKKGAEIADKKCKRCDTCPYSNECPFCNF